MKKLIIALLIVCMILSLAACKKTEDTNEDENNTPVGETDVSGDNGDESGDEQKLVFDYENEDLTPYIKLGEYKGLKANKQSTVLTEDEFVDYMNSMLSYYTMSDQIIDRPIAEGDTVVIDYSGSMEGEEFAGGAAMGVEMVAGDGHGYIPGFGAAVVGHMPGDVFSADMVFPDDYPNNPDYAGKPVTFHYTIHYIKGEDTAVTLDTLTDEFAINTLGFGSAAEFVQTQRESCEMVKAYSSLSSMNLELWQQIVDNSEVIAYPEGTFEEMYGEYREMYEYYASYYGTDYDTYLSEYEGITDEELQEQCRGYVKENLVVYALVRELDADVTQAEIDGKVAFFAELYGATPDDILSYYGEESMKTTALYDKVLAIVASYGEITEVD